MTIGIVTNRSAAVQPLFSAPVQWAIRVLAWLAFLITSYLAYKSIGHGVASSCIMGSADCEAVQTSSWSVWLGLPVAMLGLACYSSLATLSLLTGLSDPRVRHWVGTAILLLSLVAALSGFWFIGVQFIALGKICFECMAVHFCGISIAALVLWSAFKGAPARSAAAATRGSASSLMALRAAIPNAPGAAAAATARATLTTAPARAVPNLAHAQTRPSLALAFSGAFALLAVLIGGQLLFPASGSTHEQLALVKPINLDGGPEASTDPATDKQRHVAKKIATELPENDPGVEAASNVQADKSGGKDLFPTPAPGSDATAKNDAANAAATKKRIVSFLGGTLSLDIYRRPVLGSREAPNVVMEFVSYDCPHCHHTHRIMRRALDRYGDQVAVVVMVIPAGIECNKEIKEAEKSKTGSCKTAEMALGVSTLDPDRFAKFHDWLMEGKDNPPSPAQVVQKAYNFVGRDRMMTLSKDDFQKQIDQNIDLYNKIQTQRGIDPKKSGLPLIIVGNTVNSGTPANEEKFIQSWEEEFGIKPAS